MDDFNFGTDQKQYLIEMKIFFSCQKIRYSTHKVQFSPVLEEGGNCEKASSLFQAIYGEDGIICNNST